MAYKKIAKFDGFTRKQVLSYVRMMIRTNNEWARKALIVLSGQQEDDERRYGQAFHENGKGFSAYDAPFLTFMADRARLEHWYYQLDLDILKRVREMISKYTVQLVNKSDKAKLMVCLQLYYKDNFRDKGVW